MGYGTGSGITTFLVFGFGFLEAVLAIIGVFFLAALALNRFKRIK